MADKAAGGGAADSTPAPGTTTDEGKGAGAAGADAGAAGADGKGKGAGAGGDKGAGDAAAVAAAAAEKKTADDAAAAAAAKKAPAKYELKLPENARMMPEDLAQIETVARENDWSNADAQAALEAHDAQLQAQATRWAEETKADKDLGGDKLEQTQAHTKAAIDFLFPKDDPHREGFIAFLNRGGAGNNIHVVRALARIGKQQSEDGNISGRGAGGGGEKTAEDVLYK